MMLSFVPILVRIITLLSLVSSFSLLKKLIVKPEPLYKGKGERMQVAVLCAEAI